MRFTNLLFATFVAVAVALPQRGPVDGEQNVQAQNRNGRPNRRPKNRPGNVIQEPPATSVQPPAVQATVTPPNDQEGNNNEENDAAQGGDNNQAINDDQNGNGNQGDNGNQNDGNNDNNNGAFDASLVPEFGIEAGQQPDGAGNCVGNNGVLIPCECPPDREEFIQLVQEAAAAGNSEGVPIDFPTGDSNADARARIGASIVVLQNLNGRGVGCPAAATTFLQQQAELA